MNQQRFPFALFALWTICLTACSSTASNPLAVTPQTRYAPAHHVHNAKKPLCATEECIYVTNPEAGTITVYLASDNGNVAPLYEIDGANTGLCAPWGVAVDKKRNIYAANNNDGYQCQPTVTVYPAGSNGNVAPSRTIAGTNTQLRSPTGIAATLTGMLYVADAPANASYYAVRVFAPNANGNAIPIRVITGAKTTLSSPVAVALYQKDLFVVNQGNVNYDPALLGFKMGAKGNKPPATDVTGGNAFSSPAYSDGAAVSSAASNQGMAYVTDHYYFIDQWGCPAYTTAGGGAILGFPSDATGNVAPTVNISGDSTELLSPCSDAVDAEGRIYVTDSALDAIFVFAATANGNVAPIQVIRGSNTELDAPESIAVL
jgi:hypothetical protein